MLDAERVLPAVLVAEQFLGVHVERSGQIVDALDRELDRAQRDEKPGRRDTARGARDEPAVHGHRLRTVFAQMHRAQPPVAAQRIVGAPVRIAARVDVVFGPGDDVVEQAHRALVRDQRAPCAGGIVVNGGGRHGVLRELAVT